jgi:hypothetical protein
MPWPLWRPVRLRFCPGPVARAGGQVHLLAAVDRAQALGLKVAGLAGGGTFGGVGDLAGGLVDAVLPGLDVLRPA